MIKRRNKALSIVMSLCLCFALLAPIFVAPGAAQASSTYKVMSAPTVVTGNAATNLGSIKVTLDDLAVAANSIVTVSLPSDFTFPNNAGVVPVGAAPVNNQVCIVAPGTGDGMVAADFAAANFAITPNKTFDIKLANVLTTTGASKFFYIYFNGVNPNNFNGDIKVTMMPPSGSAFSLGQDLVIGKTTSSGATLSTIKKVVDLTDAGGALDIITVNESSPDTFQAGDNIKLEILTNGFKFDTAAAGDVASYGWDFAAIPAENILPAMFSSSDKLLTYNVNAGVGPIATAGRISFANLSLIVDDTKVKPGDVCEIKVSGTNVTSQTLQVATYVSYGVTVEAGTSKDLVAGQKAQELGNFTIKEGAPASLLNNRIVSFTLPEGVEFDNVNTGSAEMTNSGNVVFNAGGSGYPTLSTDKRILKWKVTTASASAAKINLKEFKVNVSPKYTGAVEIEVAGSANAAGKVKVADVKPAATLSVAKVANIELGKANQKIDDVIITEGIVKGILDNANPQNLINVTLDDGYRFSKTPTVSVVEGDIDVDGKGATVGNNGRTLTIKVNSKSAKTASKIKIADIYLDAYRTAPEGPITLKFDAGASALNETGGFVNDSPGKTTIANCVTPSMQEGANGSAVGQFKISSNIYEVNGVAKVMDAAPYIKAGRTYVPVRYLGYALGAADADVVWDAAAQKVTITKGDKKVELTIGSTTITVNGEAKTMEVAPEINNGRTMLPARYVAEGLGYQVGWDAATGTVLISK